VVTERVNGARVQGAIAANGFTYDLWYDTSFRVTTPRAESFLLPALLAGMAAGESIEVLAPVSPLLLERVPEIQRLLTMWHPWLHHVEVRAPTTTPPDVARPGRRASFFSGGVDSFSTVLRHRSELGALILVRGSEIDVSNDALWSLAVSGCQRAADELGMELLTVTTNVRALAARAGDWNLVGHGIGFASVGLLFQQAFETIYLATSLTPAEIYPWGSHPMLDPMLGTEYTRIEHDGLEFSRYQKLQFIAESDVAMRHLRVCNLQTDAYNCGTCEKCLRTAVGLHLAGALGRCQTLPYRTLPMNELHTLWVPSPQCVTFHRENIVVARKAGANDLVEHLESALWRYELRETVSRLRRLVGDARLSRVTEASRRMARRLLGGA
jgi:hypothetical protein